MASFDRERGAWLLDCRTSGRPSSFPGACTFPVRTRLNRSFLETHAARARSPWQGLPGNPPPSANLDLAVVVHPDFGPGVERTHPAPDRLVVHSHVSVTGWCPSCGGYGANGFRCLKMRVSAHKRWRQGEYSNRGWRLRRPHWSDCCPLNDNPPRVRRGDLVELAKEEHLRSLILVGSIR